PLLPRLELPGDRPARRAILLAKSALQRERVHLDDDAVDLVLQRLASGFGLLVVADDVRERRAQSILRIRVEPELTRAREGVGVRLDVEAVERGGGMAEHLGRACRVVFRVELTEAPAGRVPRVHELGLTALDLLRVHLREALLREDDLAADLETRRKRRS